MEWTSFPKLWTVMDLIVQGVFEHCEENYTSAVWKTVRRAMSQAPTSGYIHLIYMLPWLS